MLLDFMCRGSNFWVDFIAAVEVELMLILKRLMVAFLGLWKLKSQQWDTHTHTNTHTSLLCVQSVWVKGVCPRVEQKKQSFEGLRVESKQSLVIKGMTRNEKKQSIARHGALDGLIKWHLEVCCSKLSKAHRKHQIQSTSLTPRNGATTGAQPMWVIKAAISRWLRRTKCYFI